MRLVSAKLWVEFWVYHSASFQQLPHSLYAEVLPVHYRVNNYGYITSGGWVCCFFLTLKV